MRVHYSWVFTIILISLAVVTQFSIRFDPFWLRVVFGLSTGLVFLIIMLIREILIGLLALSKDTEVRKITLLAFGGSIATALVRPTMPALAAL